VVFCPLTSTQAEAYQNFLDSDIVEHIRNSGELCDCKSQKKAGWCCHMFLDDGTKWQNWVFPAISNLHRLSNHLALLIPQGNDPQEKQAKDLDYLQIAMPEEWSDVYRTRDSILHMGNPEFCGKWVVLKRLLKFWHEQGDNKVLVFSHSVRLLKMLQRLFISTSYTVNFLDGSMHYEDRYAAVQEFNTDPTQFVFLISTKAGGIGLNITSANKVVVVDPNWNPSYDLQAQDRAYRIGQTRDVEVFRLISQGTLEEIIYARQIYKQQQANIGYNATSERRYFAGVQDRKDQKGEIFGLKNLFAYQNEHVVLRDIVNKTNIAESRADVKIAQLEIDEQDLDDQDDENAAPDDETGLPRIKTEPDIEDAAMSQLAAEIIGEKEKRSRGKTAFGKGKSAVRKSDPVSAILSSVGVSYTHENSEVIGSSKVETLLSKRAQEAAEGGGTQDQLSKVFQDESQSQTNGHVYRHGNGNHDDGGIMTPDGTMNYRYRPPESVKKRQFCSMAKWAGEDVVSFALRVEAMTQAERRECLDRFYHYRRDLLDGLIKEEEDIKVEDVKQEDIKDEDTSTYLKTEDGVKQEIKDERAYETLSEDEVDEL
jgi:superfamily II DNA/RNA helicase